MAKIKKGSAFESFATFTEEEWAALHPFDEFLAAVGQGKAKYPLTITIDEETRTVFMRAADTSSWSIGPAQFDFKIIKNGRSIALPGDHNVELIIIAGVA
ncbi:hypothetical protein [Paracoccus sp. SSK6]|uniref:hypothetical protein n=1 Tax=Paracoccus sp. SSK6 TaxID=3143131 RepID=UPI00321BE601